MRVDNEKKSDKGGLTMRKSDGVDYERKEKKTNGVRVDHKKKRKNSDGQ